MSAKIEITDLLEEQASLGSIPAQLKLARHHLALAGTQNGGNDHARLAVDWLVKASRQGNEEATEKLKSCLQKQLGIDQSNLTDVRWCINTPQFEKIARESARQLFRKIQPFGRPQDRIAKADFMEHLDKLVTTSVEKTILQKAGKSLGTSDEITEEVFVSKLMRRLNGYSGTIALTSLLQHNDVQWDAYKNSNFFLKLSKYPGKSLAWIADNTIEVAGSQGRQWLRTLIPVNQLYMLIILFVYSLISLQAVVWIVPILTFYASYAAMMISTMQMFHARRKLKDVRALAGMLERYNEKFSVESAESAYCWNSLTPYVTFFISLPLLISSFSVADKTWTNCSELAVVSFLVTVACFFALSDRYDFITILSVILDSISTLPMFIEGLPKIPVLYNGLQLILGDGVSLQLLPQFYVQIGIPSLAYSVIPFLFLRMAMWKSWRGTYQVLIPHLVCFFWWRVVMMFYSQTSLYGLLRGSVGWIGLVILLPFVAVAFVAWMIYAFSFTSFVRIVTTLVLLVVVAAIALWSRSGFKIGKKFSLDKKSTKINVLMSLVLVVSAVPLMYIVIPGQDTGQNGMYLDWETYRENCGPPSWQRSSIANATAHCIHYSGAMVNWSGEVNQVHVKRVENQAESFINHLPTVVSNWLKCIYGDPYHDNCTTIEDSRERFICEFNRERGRICHLKKLNRYTFEIIVAASPHNDQIKLEAVHFFHDIALKLRPGDNLFFIANLVENLGAVSPVLRLCSVRCDTCEDSSTVYGGSMLGRTGWTLLVQLKYSLEAVWNFFLAPIFVFKYSS